jgi:methyltransferase-like protein
LSGPLQINSLILQNLRDLLKAQPDEYLLHDHLEAINEPLYLYQFVERAEQHGLQYLADAESSPLIANYLPSQFIRSIEGLAKSPVELEQLIDFLYMRSFRQTLLCHAGLPLNRQPGPESLKSLTIASSAKPVTAEFDLHSTEEIRFRSEIGASLTTGQPLNKAALLHLAEIWPQGVSFDRLLTIARARLNPTASLVYNTASLAREIETLGSFLLKGYALNLIEFRAYAPHFTLEINEYPVASALARLQAQEGRQVTNQCHEIVTLDNEISHYLLPYLDGHHNRTQLLEELMALVKAGTLVVQMEDQPASESESVRQILAEALEQTLRYLAQNALLVG